MFFRHVSEQAVCVADNEQVVRACESYIKLRKGKEGGRLMAKDTHLINIYLKIHNKQHLTMDDLRYLAQYAPECFEKTCKNVVYNFPAAKPIVDPSADERQKALAQYQPPGSSTELSEQQVLCGVHTPEASEHFVQTPEQHLQSPEQQNITQILENLKRLETNDFPFTNVEADDVKSLLGNLYMELLFPHNDKDTFFNAPLFDAAPSIDFKV